MLARTDRLYTALRTITDTEKRMLRAALQKSDAGRRAIVDERRALGEAINQVAQIFGEGHPAALDSENRSKLTRLLSDYRSSTTLHWAKWPMSIAGSDHDGYMDSARGVAKKSQSFWLACRAHLKIDF